MFVTKMAAHDRSAIEQTVLCSGGCVGGWLIMFSRQAPGMRTFTPARAAPNPAVQLFSELLGDGLILTPNGEHWHRQRAILTPAFHHEHLRRFFEDLVGIAAPVVDSLGGGGGGDAARDGSDRSVEVQQEMAKITFRAACQFVLGIDVTKWVP